MTMTHSCCKDKNDRKCCEDKKKAPCNDSIKKSIPSDKCCNKESVPSSCSSKSKCITMNADDRNSSSTSREAIKHIGCSDKRNHEKERSNSKSKCGGKKCCKENVMESCCSRKNNHTTHLQNEIKVASTEPLFEKEETSKCCGSSNSATEKVLCTSPKSKNKMVKSTNCDEKNQQSWTQSCCKSHSDHNNASFKSTCGKEKASNCCGGDGSRVKTVPLCKSSTLKKNETSKASSCCSKAENKSCIAKENSSKTVVSHVETCVKGCGEHSHTSDYSTPCCNKGDKKCSKVLAAKDNKILCIAVLRCGGTEIDIIDSNGHSKTFVMKGKNDTNATEKKNICFSTHGAGNGEYDGLLTHCFVADGIHGEPDDACFCGIDTVHIHAHYHDPIKCLAHGKYSNIQNLAQVTLFPSDDGKEGLLQARFEECDSLPKICNSKDVAETLGIHQEKRWPGYSKMYMVQHNDHLDHLVHDKKTGHLHLEHDCNSCEGVDFHGNLHLLHKRSWNYDEESNHGGKTIDLQFVEISKRSFHLMNFISELFSIESSGRVAAAKCCSNPYCIGDCDGRYSNNFCKGKASDIKKNTHEDESVVTDIMSEINDLPLLHKTTGRSSFQVDGICCSSEIPEIQSIINPLPGVNDLKINVTNRIVYVDHDSSITSAQDIADALNKQNFRATIKKDAGKAVVAISNQTTGRSSFKVDGICCSSEIPAVQNILNPLSGVTDVKINVTTKTVYVDHDTLTISAQDIANALNIEQFSATILKDAGKTLAQQNLCHTKTPLTSAEYVESTLMLAGAIDYDTRKAILQNAFSKYDSIQVKQYLLVSNNIIKVDHNPSKIKASDIADAISELDEHLHVSVLSDGEKEGQWVTPQLDDDDLDKIDKHTSKLNPYVAFSGLFWIVSMFSMIGGNWEYLRYVGLLSVVLGLPSIAKKAYRTLRRYKFDVNCLMLIAALGAVALQDFPEAAAVTFLFSISEWLETRATAKARNALAAIVQLRPERANLVLEGTTRIVRASDVPVQSLVSCRTGDKIPCDGVVVQGNSQVDESSLTGESKPVQKSCGDTVSGGTINVGMTQLLIRTTSTADDSAVSRLIRLVEEAQANQSETEMFINNLAKFYTPLVILVAFSMMTFPWIAGTEVGRAWTMNGLITLVVACPCALIISTPVTYVAGLATAAQRGIIIKGGACLEALGKVGTVCFDKTGTLTKGEFALVHFNMVGDKYDRKDAMELLFAMESSSSHPLATALIAAARNEGILEVPKHLVVQDHSVLPGEGVKAIVNDEAVYVGNTRLMERLGVLGTVPPHVITSTQEWASAGGTVGFLCIKSNIICAYSVADSVRPESNQVVSSLLKNFNIESIMLTGDNRHAAQVIGTEVGLSTENIKSELLPKEKLDIVTRLKDESENITQRRLWTNRRLVLMCGDGVNDAPALACASVGVAMGAGSAIAMETSDVTLMDSNLNKLYYSIKLGRKVIRTIYENVVFSIVVKGVVLGLTVAGMSTLWMAIASDVGAMLIVTLNGMKLLRTPEKKRMLEKDIEEHIDQVVAETPSETA